MKLKLVRHTFPDDPDWIILRENIPIGTEYEMLGYESDMQLWNASMNKTRTIDCYFVRRLNDDRLGYVPCICLEMIES
jgi:hypothetical protein